MSPDGVPTRAELISQAVNGDMVRIIRNSPPRPLVIARRFEITRRVAAVVTALAFGAAVVASLLTLAVAFTMAVVAATIGLLYVVLWAATIRFAHLARVELLRKYGVAPNSDGVFELLRAAEPHGDLAATREALREYAQELQPKAA